MGIIETITAGDPDEYRKNQKIYTAIFDAWSKGNAKEALKLFKTNNLKNTNLKEHLLDAIDLLEGYKANEKVTQGRKKLLQYFNDLKKNKLFIDSLEKMNHEKNENRLKKLKISLAKNFGFSSDMLIALREKDKKWEDFLEARLFDRADLFQLLNINESKNNINNDEFMDLYSHPVSIHLHMLMTKRDLIDYVEKNWVFIENRLERFRKRTIIRKRNSAEITNFIFDNFPKMGVKKLKMTLDDKFPQNTLIYCEINKTYDLEKKRRSKDNTLGI